MTPLRAVRRWSIAAAMVAAATPVFAGKGDAPVPADTQALMRARDMAPSAPVLLRSYKKDSVIEVWKQTRAGRYALLKSFPICRWSGQLGPKTKTGDRQAPEGFYSVAQKQLNPNSHYYLSFDLGYPNAYDRAHGATGNYLMVHGICSSAGCYAMTDTQIGEIYALVRDALGGGQAGFQFQAFPFRMTAENLAKHRADKNIAFWRQLKEGADRFEATGEEPKVSVVGGHYTFAARSADSEAKATERVTAENARIAALVTDGAASVRTTYSDGGQHAIFAAMLRNGANLGDVSRPEALAYAGREEILTPARPIAKPIAVAARLDAPAPRMTIDDVPRTLTLSPIAGASAMLGYGLGPLPAQATFALKNSRVSASGTP